MTWAYSSHTWAYINKCCYLLYVATNVTEVDGKQLKLQLDLSLAGYCLQCLDTVVGHQEELPVRKRIG